MELVRVPSPQGPCTSRWPELEDRRMNDQVPKAGCLIPQKTPAVPEKAETGPLGPGAVVPSPPMGIVHLSPSALPDPLPSLDLTDGDKRWWCPSLQEVMEAFHSLGARSPALGPEGPCQSSER